MSEDQTRTSSPAKGVANSAPATSGAAASNDTRSSVGASAASEQESARESEDESEDEGPWLARWITAKTLEKYWDTRKMFFTEEQRADAWKETAEIVERYSDELIDRWNKEIDNLLIYAGLFSAIQTAFNIELYKRLIPDPAPAPDPVLVALERISAQLSGFTVNQAFVNSTQSP